MAENSNRKKIVVFGGNGFVGCNVIRALINLDAEVVSVSRKGYRPVHLHNQDWAGQAEWIRGDANYADRELLNSAACVVSLVGGSTPIPAIGNQPYLQQVADNGTANVKAIAAARDAGVKRIVLLGAKIPKFMSGDWSGYAKGKRLALEAAESFAQLSDEHSAAVVQPGGMYGKRHTESGKEIPIDLVLRPMSKLMSSQLISVELVANRIAKEALSNPGNDNSWMIIKHKEI